MEEKEPGTNNPENPDPTKTDRPTDKDQPTKSRRRPAIRSDEERGPKGEV
jgi:hypothetical protein